MEKDWMTYGDVEALAQEALEAAVLHIQNALGVQDGGAAALFFSDGMADHVLQCYIKHEIYQNKILFADDDEAEVRYLSREEA